MKRTLNHLPRLSDIPLPGCSADPEDVIFQAEWIATEKIEVATHRLVSKAVIERSPDWRQDLRHEFQYDLRTYMVGIFDHEITDTARWPATWWDHFKNSCRLVPRWFVKRYPVRWDGKTLRVQAYKAVCPHVSGSDEECQGFFVTEHRR